MNDIKAKLARRRQDRQSASTQRTLQPARDAATAFCGACDSEWGALSSDDIAELMIQAGRFREDERASLLAMDRERIVELFCGCSVRPRLDPLADPARRMGRR